MPRPVLSGLPLLLAACGASPSAGPPHPGHDRPAIRELLGEIHLHQFPLGSHGWAGVLARPVVLDELHTDQLVELSFAPTSRRGDCALYLPPSCTPPCAAHAYCAAKDSCRAFAPVTYVDGGDFHVTGSRVAPRIRLFWSDRGQTYDSEPPPGSAPLFAGGERLELTGGRGDYALAGSLGTPLPVEMESPDLRQPLRLPVGDWTIRWRGAGAHQVVVLVNASTRQGRSGYIKCVTADVGRVTVPGEMLAALPATPRDIRLEVERHEERILPLPRQGQGFIVHAAFSAWQNGSE